ncbi:hypothetical protein ACIPSE_17280 [Streptomyces sp. NPDC090106]|uniref:hypothetical protein n=1 Tax=Streptomyces sp. NPDC090106 TaxID=3365946 RepID=UPI00381894DC
MSDARTIQPPHADEASTGHGRHRGQISDHDGDTSPRGRHRRQVAVEETETAA